MIPCPDCEGKGRALFDKYDPSIGDIREYWGECGGCEGTGEVKPICTGCLDPFDGDEAGVLCPECVAITCPLCGFEREIGQEVCEACQEEAAAEALASEGFDPEEQDRIDRLMKVLPEGDYTADEMREYLE